MDDRSRGVKMKEAGKQRERRQKKDQTNSITLLVLNIQEETQANECRESEEMEREEMDSS